MSGGLCRHLLYEKLVNLLFDLLKLSLLGVTKLLGFIVLLLDLLELDGNLSDFLQFILIGGGVVGGLQESCGLDVG